jgi:alkylresorcinol/alkylpyrone synthase
MAELVTSSPFHCAAIAATATAVPRHTLTREDVKTHVRSVFELDERRADAMMLVIDNARVQKRHAIFPLAGTIERRSLTQTSSEYHDHAVSLGREVAETCLMRAGMTAADVDMIISVSCTGFMIPSLDAHLINLMGFRPGVRRLPVTELGCAAGAMALGHAAEHIRARPGDTVLIVSVELPTLTFQRDDVSQANLISSVLFGDGAAAALVTGRRRSGLCIRDSETYTFPQSLDAMGFDLRDTGFHIVLSRDVPDLVRGRIKGLVDDFLLRRGLSRDRIGAFLLHPGGQKLLMYLEEQLGLCRRDTRLSWDVLAKYGNLSSATILFILDAFLAQHTMAAGDHAVAAAFGPGFTAELVLLQWV